MKKEKGITLIALVITIVVLIILATVSINLVISDDGIIKSAEKAKDLYQNADAKEQEDLANLSELFEEEPQWSLPEGDTQVNVGDLLTPTVEGLANEKFYVIADDGTTLTLLAERCINTSTNKQVDSGYSNVAFDDNSSVYNGSDIQGLVNTYVGTLTGLKLEDVEVEYNGEPVSDVKGRLLWLEEASTIQYSLDLFLADVDFWLGSAYNENQAYLVVFNSNSQEVWMFEAEVTDTLGLRPVIKILKSAVE